MLRTVVGWMIVAGIAGHLMGAGPAFASLAGELLAMAAVAGGFLLIINPKRRVGQVLGRLLLATMVIGFLPPFIAGGLRDLTRSLSWTAVVVLLSAALLAVVLVGKR